MQHSPKKKYVLFVFQICERLRDEIPVASEGSRLSVSLAGITPLTIDWR